MDSNAITNVNAANNNVNTDNEEALSERPALYHYTAGWEKIAAILATGCISKEAKLYEGHVTLVWLSANPVWEKTVMKVNGGLNGHAKRLVAFRLKVNYTPVHLWSEFRKTSGEKQKICDALEKIGRRQGADPAEWYCSPRHIPVCENTVESVGIYQDEKWEDLPLEEFKKKYEKELSEVKIIPITLLQIDKLMRRGYVLSPVLVDRLTQIAESGKSEPLALATIGKIIHLLPVAE